MLKERVTPLLLSVSTMPFIEVEFDPFLFSFEQNGQKWSPSEKHADAFSLGENDEFGGIISDQDVHQGVVMIPAGFDLNKPIKVSYKNFKKMCRFK